MEVLEQFGKIASSINNPEIETWKKADGRVIGTVCSNIPEEILHAAGLLAVRLRAPGLHDTSSADSQLHRINCSYTRSLLELLLRGDLAFLDGLVTTNTCDHMLRLAGEMEDKAGFPFVHYFSMYHALGSVVSEWFILEMQYLMDHLKEVFGVDVSEAQLRRSITLHNRVRALMSRLNELRKHDPPPVSGSEYLQIALAGMSMPKERFNDTLEILVPQLEKRKSGRPTLPRLLLLGGGCDAPEFVGFLESKGAWIVADALCFGTRHYQGIIEENSKTPLEAIANRYVGRIPCPSIINGFDFGSGLLKKTIQDWRIDGVICARLKFCDHWAGMRKLLAEELRHNNSVPVLDLEREYSTTASGQVSTRVQAFLEMIKS